MAASSISSPFCSFVVAAFMPFSCDKDHLFKSSKFQYSKLVIQRSHFKKYISEFSHNGIPHYSHNLLQKLNGSAIQNLVDPYLSFKPHEKFCNFSMRLSSMTIFGDNALSLHGSKAALMNQLKSRRNCAPTIGRIAGVAQQAENEVEMETTPFTQCRRVVVTGLGVVTSVGQDVDEFYNNLLAGVSGISEIEGFDCAQFPTKIAGEIKSFSADGWVSAKISRRADKFLLYMLTAGKKAAIDGGITEEAMKELDKTRAGVIIGTAMGGMKIATDGSAALRVSYKKMNPFNVPFGTINMGPAILSMDLGWMGPNYTVSSACATSNFCILNAANHIISGETDLMLCGGSDAAIIPIGLGSFMACRTLSQRNDDPTKASRPWDCDRDGFVLGEGAGVLLLEDLEHAKKRGAKIYAEFLGGSFTFDANHRTEPRQDGIGVAFCIEQALAQSGVAREDINYINAYAASTKMGDLREYRALVRCFRNNSELKINSTKSMIGHLLGASGAVEAVATVKAIQTGWVHPNINLENPDKAVDMRMMVGSKKEHVKIKVALSNSVGFGGHNSSILFAPYESDETPKNSNQ